MVRYELTGVREMSCLHVFQRFCQYQQRFGANFRGQAQQRRRRRGQALLKTHCEKNAVN